jgi:hypothetical protein
MQITIDAEPKWKPDNSFANILSRYNFVSLI